jgi:ribonuclease HI
MAEPYLIYFDGGARNNPGPAGYGVVVAEPQGSPILMRGRYIGNATNNVAEYQGLIEGLKLALELKLEHVLVRGDSQLVINQMAGSWKIRHENMKPLHQQASELARKFKSIRFEHVYREQNGLADKLYNRAIDRRGEVHDVED